MQNSGQRVLRFFLLMLIFSAIGFVLQACGGEDENGQANDKQDATADNASPVSGLRVGDTAPAFTLPAVEGGDVSLTDYVGEQPVLLYFHMAVG